MKIAAMLRHWPRAQLEIGGRLTLEMAQESQQGKSTPGMALGLRPRESARLALDGALRVRCVAGILWIVGADCEDHILQAGQAALLSKHGLHHLSSLTRDAPVTFELRLEPV
ncbi:DUF2917 domain-containing protein [Massilia sp. YIM B04103]|uniref:DUF2917 domain-containing protein n=1 Tax=Massilia sp. YIM B04103 TaxID=2963106 RepID=UPI00210A5E21|nr:DUF2917 domain-containing protein [Massilia sp. YIM B04103]